MRPMTKKFPTFASRGTCFCILYNLGLEVGCNNFNILRVLGLKI